MQVSPRQCASSQNKSPPTYNPNTQKIEVSSFNGGLPAVDLQYALQKFLEPHSLEVIRILEKLSSTPGLWQHLEPEKREYLSTFLDSLQFSEGPSGCSVQLKATANAEETLTYNEIVLSIRHILNTPELEKSIENAQSAKKSHTHWARNVAAILLVLTLGLMAIGGLGGYFGVAPLYAVAGFLAVVCIVAQLQDKGKEWFCSQTATDQQLPDLFKHDDPVLQERLSAICKLLCSGSLTKKLKQAAHAKDFSLCRRLLEPLLLYKTTFGNDVNKNRAKESVLKNICAHLSLDTIWSHAIWNGLEDLCQALLDACADPNSRLSDVHVTPLVLAAYKGRHQIFKALLAAGADAGSLEDFTLSTSDDSWRTRVVDFIRSLDPETLQAYRHSLQPRHQFRDAVTNSTPLPRTAAAIVTQYARC